jgi:glycerol-3-phosphate dehydrogenase
MWDKGWRDQVWSSLDQKWDIIVIGGGITGAGILREAARLGLRTLLVENKDFASGTSSRSSKLVHGGLRYLQNAQIKLTFDSVRERERLLREGRGLVIPLGFLLANYSKDRIPAWLFGAALGFYDILAFKWAHRHYDELDMRELCPPLNGDGLLGGYRFFDAETDDARLVMRLIEEACQDGGIALNYARATNLISQTDGRVCGIILQDQVPGSSRNVEVIGSVVINATGAWADVLRAQVGGRPRLRKLRGSHLVFSSARLPLTRGVSLWHPRDGRAIFAFPWEGVTIVGTTDIDHQQSMETEPAISPSEVEYLMELIHQSFPSLELAETDVLTTFSGVRPVIDTGKANPSKESREHALWCELGLVTVTGGKLTTFRLMAWDALRMACTQLVNGAKLLSRAENNLRILNALPENMISGQPSAAASAGLRPASRLRLFGRYGIDAVDILSCAKSGELELIPGSLFHWAELRWAARSGAVIHLEDLLLRRLRLGLVLPEGGLLYADRIRSIVQPELGWDDQRWEQELSSYSNLWNRCYKLSI